MQSTNLIVSTAHHGDQDRKTKPIPLNQQPITGRDHTNEQATRRRPSKISKTTRVPIVNPASRSNPKKLLVDITGVIINNVKAIETNPKTTEVCCKDPVSHKPANIGLKVVMSQL
jgi:hypothetical protein